jgi:hypothetical protein
LLIIRDEQMRVLARGLRRSLQDHAFQYLRTVWKPETSDFDDTSLRAFVESAYERAAAFGFDHDADILTLIEAFLLFGSGFVGSPNYPWAAHLADRRVRPAIKAANLRARIQHELQCVAGRADGNGASNRVP